MWSTGLIALALLVVVFALGCLFAQFPSQYTLAEPQPWYNFRPQVPRESKPDFVGSITRATDNPRGYEAARRAEFWQLARRDAQIELDRLARQAYEKARADWVRSVSAPVSKAPTREPESDGNYTLWPECP